MENNIGIDGGMKPGTKASGSTPSTVGLRVKARRMELNLSQTELAIKSGLTQPTISALEKGRSNSTGSMARIATALGVSPLWLETGMGDAEAGKSEPAPQAADESYMVPLLEAKGSCGSGRLYGDLDYSPIAISARLLGAFGRSTAPDRLMGLYADGDSMSSYIMNGDIIVFDTGITDFHQSDIYLLDTPDGLRVKRITRRANGQIVLRSDNPDKVRYPDEEYSVDQASLLTVKGRFVLRIGG